MEMEFAINNEKSATSNVGLESSDDSAEVASERGIEKRSQSRKRKADTEIVAARNKRIKSAYNDGYREVLNSMIEDALSLESIGDYGSYDASQLGISKWFPIEKDVFFAQLDRLGRHDIRGIAAAIPSKSEPEVREYLRLLQQGCTEHCLHAPRQQLLGPTDIPAAFEISQACCDVLDEAGRALELYQGDSDVRRERDRFGDYCILDQKTASDLEKCVEDQHIADVSVMIANVTDLNRPGPGKVPLIDLGLQLNTPAIQLLNLRKWLELSEKVFMNPGASRLEDNWTSIAGRKKKPAMFATAFADFHNLTVSVTKRLVHTILFQATSRLRATDFRANRYRSGALVVKRRDVLAALNVLGLDHNANSFWIAAPRRCGLEVYDDDAVKGRGSSSLRVFGAPLKYGEVEKRLTEGDAHSKPESSSRPDSRNEEEEDIDEAPTFKDKYYGGYAENSLYRDDDSAGNDTSSLDDVPIGNAAPPVTSPEIEDYHDQESEQQDKHTEAFDEYTSLVEEQKLWAMLNQSPPTEIKPEDIILPKAPKPQRKKRVDIVDWTDHVHYRSEWERYGTTILPEAFVRTTSEHEDVSGNPGKATTHTSPTVGAAKKTATVSQRTQHKQHNGLTSVVHESSSAAPSEAGAQIIEDDASEDHPSDRSTDYAALDMSEHNPDSDAPEHEQPRPSSAPSELGPPPPSSISSTTSPNHPSDGSKS